MDHKSSAADLGVKFQDEENPTQNHGTSAGNENTKVPTWKDLTVQASRIRSLTKRTREAVPPEPRSIPPYLAFRCIEIDMSTFSPGVYLLIRDNAVVYVGSSIAVITRIGSHRQGYERKDFHRAVYLPCRADELLKIEGALIRFFEPEYNSVTSAPFFGGASDRDVRRMFQLPDMHPEIRKLYRARMKLKKMTAARKAASSATATPCDHPDDDDSPLPKDPA